MLNKIEEILSERCRVNRPALIVVGVSGGPDSLCLMHVLHSLGFRLIIAHLDHQLRAESEAEGAFVASAAAALGLECVSERVDVRSRAWERRQTIEEAAREARYAFLFGLAQGRSAAAVAVGHSADDQVETALMHLIRGAGSRGLAGMKYRTTLNQFNPSIPLIRPLLAIWRQEILEYCRANSLTPIHDPSNDSPAYFRNRVRHELVPLLEQYNARVRSAIWRTAEILGVEGELADERTAQLWQGTVLRRSSTSVGFDASELRRHPATIQRHLLRMAVEGLRLGAELDYEDFERAVAFIADSSASRMDLGEGIFLAREANIIYLASGELPAEDWPQLDAEPIRLPANPPFSVSLSNGWQFKVLAAETTSAPLSLIAAGGDEFQIWLDADQLPGHMELRCPRTGDRFMPLGLEGHANKLSDFFVNVKLPRRFRSRFPLLSSDQKIIWVPGFRPADEFKLRAQTRRAMGFRFLRQQANEGAGPG